MTPTLKTEWAKLSLSEKLALATELDAEIQAEIEALGCPPAVMSEDDPRLAEELLRRWQEAKEHPERMVALQAVEERVSRRFRSGA